MIFQVSTQAGFRNVISRCRSKYRREHDTNMTLVKQIRFWKMNEAGILRVRGYSVTRVTGLQDILSPECNEIDAGNEMDDCLETWMIEERNNKFDGGFLSVWSTVIM